MNILFASLLALASKKLFPPDTPKAAVVKIAAFFCIINERTAVYLTIWIGFFHQ